MTLKNKKIGPITAIAALLILLIALAGVWKLTADRAVVYPVGTKFIAAGSQVISPRNFYDNVSVYRIPKNATIEFPDGTRKTVAETFNLLTRPTDRTYPVSLDAPGTKSGSTIVVGENIDARNEASEPPWWAGTMLLLIPLAMLTVVYLTWIRKGKSSRNPTNPV